VYLFFDADDQLLYVGKAKHLRDRVRSYFTSPVRLTGKTRALVEKIRTIRIIQVTSEIESLLLEANLIKQYAPRYNIDLKDGKAYPLIRVAAELPVPAVLTARRMEHPGSIYFGPFPSAGSVRIVLRILRRIFPYQSTANHPHRICLYHHLGLCPCVSINGDISAYKKTISRIIRFLSGDTKTLINELIRERDKLSHKEAFEEASRIQKQIDAILHVTQRPVMPSEYVTNPHLKSDVRMKEMESLMQVLAQHNVMIPLPVRIECYDISHIQGTHTVGSMTVLIDGEPAPSEYKRFKIRTVTGSNDFAALQEVISRRLKHPEWGIPSLIVIDGGKGQLSACTQLLEDADIPFIGLAKREETIITSHHDEILLPKRSPALQMVMRIRDEAHRFALSYHRLLRSRQYLAKKRSRM
jgi:excinuclease ABC subunit C